MITTLVNVYVSEYAYAYAYADADADADADAELAQALDDSTERVSPMAIVTFRGLKKKMAIYGNSTLPVQLLECFRLEGGTW
jgi:hypothetical protein